MKKITNLLYVGDEIRADGFQNVSAFGNYARYSSTFNKRWDTGGSDVAVIWRPAERQGFQRAWRPRMNISSRESLTLPTTTGWIPRMSSTLCSLCTTSHSTTGPFFLALVAGCSVLTVDWFSASKFWEHIARYKATVVYSTGTIMAILLKQEVGEFEKKARELLRFWVPWPLDQPEVARARWPKIRFVEGYGLTEYSIAVLSTFDNPEPGCQGIVTPYTEFKICDPETGQELPADKVGEVVVRSKLGRAYMMRGYYKSPEETERTIKDGWLHTGDAGHLDENGCFHFSDRLKDSVRVGGENVPSLEVEAIIKGHPKIAEVAVVGVKGDLGPRCWLMWS